MKSHSSVRGLADAPLRTLVVLGKNSDDGDKNWLKSGIVGHIVRFKGAAPSGYRRRSRMLGLGLDSAVVAFMAAWFGGPYLAMNPWVAVALRCLGKRDVAVIGLYAEPGSRSFKVLRRVLADSPVVTTVAVEANAWVAAGGRATEVLYGNTFHYPAHQLNNLDGMQIFVGGSSDRDAKVIRLLEAEVRSARSAATLVIVAAEEPQTWSDGKNAVLRTGYVSAERFGELLAASDVVFLPLKQGVRAAGHMVTVGALESGVPVFTTPSIGMKGYVDGHVVREIEPDQALLPQLREYVIGQNPVAIRAHWQNCFSQRAFIARVGAALQQLENRGP